MSLHPEARAKARKLVDAYDGGAHEVVEARVERKLQDGDFVGALKEDQLRREIVEVYKETGEFASIADAISKGDKRIEDERERAVDPGPKPRQK